MITNIRILLSDDERARVAAAFYGSHTPVTRKQVNEIVEAIFEQLKSHAVIVSPPVLGQPTQTKSTARPARPHDASYMRGWNAVGHAIRKIKEN